MIRRIVQIVLIGGFLFLNVYFFSSALEFSRIYPLKRALVGNVLATKIEMAEPLCEFGSIIKKVGNKEVNNENLSKLLKEFKDKKELNFTISYKNQIINKKIIKEDINKEFFLFLMFILLFANIHYVWGSLLYFFRPQDIRIKLYFYCALSISLFFFLLIERFTSGGYGVIFVFVILVLGYLIILLGYNLSNQRFSKLAYIPVLIFSSAMVFITAKNIINESFNISVYNYLFIYLVFCILFTSTKLIKTILNGKQSYISHRNIVFFFGLFPGFFIPVINNILSIYSDYNFPVCIISSLTLIFPLLLGKGFLKYNQFDYYGFKIFQVEDLRLLLLNLIISVICASLLYTVSSQLRMEFAEIIHISAIIAIFILLLNGQHLISRTLNESGYEKKDDYAFSAQSIAELSSSSDSLEKKLENIYKEIIDQVGASSLKIILFKDTAEDYYLNFKEFIELLSKESPILKLINSNPGIILKYALIKNSKLEENVYNFLERRNFIIVVPMIGELENIGALLVGEKKRKGLYSDSDIKYFSIVSAQLTRMIGNDWLYKDYILKKRYEKELDNASYVQLRLFPKAHLDIDRGLHISCFYRPYLRVIGDYFDFFNVDEDRTAIIIGDVSGHGLSAAMILSAVNSITYVMLRELKNLEITFNEINYFLNKSYRGIELITLFIGIFNRKTKELEFINAGHGAPVYIKKHDKKLEYIEGRSKILGADPNAKYTLSRVILNKDDELILYTDGVMEIYNEKTGASLDEEKFIDIISKNIEKDVDRKIIAIEKSIKYHSEAIKDDITILGVKIH